MKLITIGGYGFDEKNYFSALKNADVDTFVDIRQRRGMRGSKYAFLNSKRLQASLKDFDIRYIHLKELAPTPEIRQAQKESDLRFGVSKRQRFDLGSIFINGYKNLILSDYSADTFQNAVGRDAKIVALFCVEKAPEACHRSLLAKYLSEQTGWEVEDLYP